MPAERAIYIVDDDIGFRRGIERLLSTYGLPVKSFSSAEDFQTRADLANASCLILDIQLGGMSGIDLMRELFRSGAEIPVVIVTANDSEPLRRAALEAGCKAYLQKPLSGRILLDAIGQFGSTVAPR